MAEWHKFPKYIDENVPREPTFWLMLKVPLRFLKAFLLRSFKTFFRRISSTLEDTSRIVPVSPFGMVPDLAPDFLSQNFTLVFPSILFLEFPLIFFLHFLNLIRLGFLQKNHLCGGSYFSKKKNYFGRSTGFSSGISSVYYRILFL